METDQEKKAVEDQSLTHTKFQAAVDLLGEKLLCFHVGETVWGPVVASRPAADHHLFHRRIFSHLNFIRDGYSEHRCWI